MREASVSMRKKGSTAKVRKYSLRFPLATSGTAVGRCCHSATKLEDITVR